MDKVIYKPSHFNSIIWFLCIVFTLIMSIICIPFDWVGTIVCLSIGLVSGIPSVIWYKNLFAYIILDDTGIFLMYKNTTLQQIKWEEIQLIYIRTNYSKNQFSFHKTNNKKEMWQQKNQIGFVFFFKPKKLSQIMDICRIVKNNTNKFSLQIKIENPNSLIAELLK